MENTFDAICFQLSFYKKLKKLSKNKHEKINLSKQIKFLNNKKMRIISKYKKDTNKL